MRVELKIKMKCKRSRHSSTRTRPWASSTHTALPFWTAAAIWRCRRDWTPFSTVLTLMWAAISVRRSCPEGPKRPTISRQNGWKLTLFSWRHILVLLWSSADAAAAPAELAVAWRLLDAHEWTIVASHAIKKPREKSSTVAPSGRLPSTRERPAGFRIAATQASETIMKELLCLIIPNSCGRSKANGGKATAEFGMECMKFS